MRIGINVLYLVPDDVGGTETYAKELIDELSCTKHKNDELIIYCNRENYRSFSLNSRVTAIRVPISAKIRPLRLLAEQIILPIYALVHGLNVMFSLGYTSPWLLLCPSVVTIHDLNWHYHPESFKPVAKFIVEWMVRISASTASHIITDSVSSADSIRSVLKLDDKHVTPILHGVPRTTPLTPSNIRATLVKYEVEKPYLFTVVSGLPHKNLHSLIRAFQTLHKSFPELNLVVCGLGGLSARSNQALIKQMGLQKRIKLLGYVTTEELAALYHSADIFVFPSAYEGFGYPVVEAMSYGTPVVSSNAFSLREVVGSGGILVDPYDVAGYVKSITRLLKSATLRQDLVTRGTLRASELKWEQTAQQTLAVLRRVSIV